MGENHLEKKPVILYGINLLLCAIAIAFVVLEKTSIHSDGKSSIISTALASKKREYASVILYLSGICVSMFLPYLGILCFVAVAILWLIPDKRIENKLKD